MSGIDEIFVDNVMEYNSTVQSIYKKAMAEHNVTEKDMDRIEGKTAKDTHRNILYCWLELDKKRITPKIALKL